MGYGACTKADTREELENRVQAMYKQGLVDKEESQVIN